MTPQPYHTLFIVKKFPPSCLLVAATSKHFSDNQSEQELLLVHVLDSVCPAIDSRAMNYGNEDEDGRMANLNSFSQILTDAIDSRAMNYGNEDGRMANLNSFSQILTDAIDSREMN
ncbi:hypothetical protein DKX38_021897 [Salix brachista]|uniref:Uncharacterized protein n=1 Tax=Salix brachista TaxID=2182728 RepID=A0A5N5JY76_9ROSI|nr:hypothetical protein DKX38_021897 [Salix brachista]